jgi:hypothetical protein
VVQALKRPRRKRRQYWDSRNIGPHFAKERVPDEGGVA